MAALLAEMDVLLGFAEVAVNAPVPYVRPQMLPPDEGELKLVGCRYDKRKNTDCRYSRTWTYNHQGKRAMLMNVLVILSHIVDQLIPSESMDTSGVISTFHTQH